MEVVKKHSFTLYNDAKLKDKEGKIEEAIKLYESCLTLFTKLKGNCYSIFVKLDEFNISIIITREH